MRYGKIIRFFIIFFTVCVIFSSTVYSNSSTVINENTFYLNGDTKNTIAILCIEGHKFIQTVIYGPNGNVSVSLVQVLERTSTGGKPAICYKSNITN